MRGRWRRRVTSPSLLAALLVAGLGTLLLPIGVANAAKTRIGLSVKTSKPTAKRATQFKLSQHLPRKVHVVRYRMTFGDKRSKTGRRLPATLRHTYAKRGTYRASLSVRDSRGRTLRVRRTVKVRAAASPAPKPVPQPAPAPIVPLWTSLTGRVESHSDELLATHVADQVGYDLVATHSASRHFVDTGSDLPGGAAIDRSSESRAPREQAVVIPPSPGFALGQLVVVLRATTPADGLQAPRKADYILFFDGATGARLAVSELHVPADWNTTGADGVPRPIGFAGGSVVISGRDHFARADPAGNVTDVVPLREHEVLDRVIGGTTAIVEESGDCDVASIYDLATLQRTASTPCGVGSVPGTKSMYTPAAFAEGGVPTVYAVATGAALTAPGQLAGSSSFMAGPRSDVVAAWDKAGTGSVYFVSAATWATVLRTDGDGSVQVYGIADNQVWMTAYGKKIVVDGYTGAVLAEGWRVSPVDGGPGWTVVDGSTTTSGQPDQHLLRSDQPLLASLDSAP